MTTAPIEQPVTAIEALPSAKRNWSAQFIDWKDRASEWLNPILVKESRQALKSRQFVITFTFMLLVTWIATIVAVTSLWPTIYYLPYGIYLLTTYSIILAAPLIIVVPFSAFRSLAVEREDGTFELVSVTSLSARQIITGKLGSAFAQIMVYCSAIAPCLVFTYLLRGVDLVRILFVIAWTIAISGGLCCISLLAATFSRARYMQSLLSVGLLFLLLGAGFMWLMAIIGITVEGENLPWGMYWFWALMGYLCMLLVCLSITCVLAASAQISFASDNHATTVRLSLFFTQALATGGFVYLVCLADDAHGIVAIAFLGCGFWAIVGSLMMGDSGFISERVRRTLPASLFGRALFSWFNPGGGTAYVFTCVTMVTGIGGSLVFCMFATEGNFFGVQRIGWVNDFRLYMVTILCILYVVAYLGASNLILAALRLYYPITPVISFVVTVFVALAACLIPLMIGIALDTNLIPAYNEVQAPNWAWTIIAGLENDVDWPIVFIVVTYTVPIFMANVLLAYREIAATKTAVPSRVIEEERALHPQPETKLPPQNPWDDGERAEAIPDSA
jgi:hypothetical protein